MPNYKKVPNQNHGITNIKRYQLGYNNWVDGTQIEAAIPVQGFGDYLPGSPDKYLELTGQWMDEYVKYKTIAICK